MNTGEVLSSFQEKYKNSADPDRATDKKRYLKSPYKFYGVRNPVINDAAKSFKKENRNIKKEDLLVVCNKLWYGEYHEEKTTAVKLLDCYLKLLDCSDMPLVESMLDQSVNWDHVDEISIHIAGGILLKEKRVFNYLKKWSTHSNFWLRRASLISQLLLFRKNEGDKELFFAFAEGMLEEKEFFIRKAIGWALREISKKDPEAAFNFLKTYRIRISNLTLKEGSRLLPGEYYERLQNHKRSVL